MWYRNNARHKEYHRWLNTARWRDLRHAVLAGCPCCVKCAEVGLLTPPTEVHHLIPVMSGESSAERERLMWDAANLVALCHQCHRNIHVMLRSHRRDVRIARERASVARAEQNLFGAKADPGGDFLKGGGCGKPAP